MLNRTIFGSNYSDFCFFHLLKSILMKKREWYLVYLTSNISAKTWSNCTYKECFETSGIADFKSVPGFENRPKFVVVIEQNKTSNTFYQYCIQHIVNLLNFHQLHKYF